MEVKVLFTGVLTDVTGTYCKHYHDVKSTGDLKLRIEDDFPEISHYNFRISVNNIIVENNLLLIDGDEVAFQPQPAGR